MLSVLPRSSDSARSSDLFVNIAAVAVMAVLVWMAGTVGDVAANPKYASIVIDARTGKTLHASNADARRYPASLTKMMTLYMVFEALDAGRITKKTRIRISKNASREPSSRLGLKAGKKIAVEQAIYALITKSANDVSTALAEHLGGSERAFARKMTAKARTLGMKRTTFHNAHGLPNRAQRTTARDMARLGLALREHFPHHYHYFSARVFRYGKARYGNHNRLLGAVKGVDGIKTGYTRASGFNLVSSVRRNGRSIVAVVMGGKTGTSRNRHMRNLIARTLPKASRKGRGRLVPRPQSAAPRIALPKIGPLPSFRDSGRNAGSDLHEFTYVPSPLPKIFPVPLDRPVIGRDALKETMRTQRAAALRIAVASPPRPTLPATGAPVASPANAPGVDTVVTASTPPLAGWVVQIGAAPTREGAERLLAKAKARTGDITDGAKAFTTVTRRNGNRLYRARFAGFSGKSEAWRACRALKKHGYGCWATRQ